MHASHSRCVRELRIIGWPFHNGLPRIGMGAGAARLAGDADLRDGLRAAGWRIVDDEVEPVDASEPEIARVVELVRRLSARVAAAVDAGAFPLVLAGNCNSSLGTVAGVGAHDLGVVWFDAHADFDDPGENTSGFFDAMGLAMLTGRGWDALRATIPGHSPIPEANVVLAGVRDLEPYQRRRLERSTLRTVPGAVDRGTFERALDELRSRASRVYLHVDLDSLDAAEATANGYAAGGGPSVDRLVECLRQVRRRFSVAAAAITSYDPAFDAGGRTLVAARRIAVQILSPS
jgi:arginase